jgi:predicted molibdopterin-dependent oxidoreductase YjgC
VPEDRGLDAEGILRAAASGDIDVLVILGADPIADFPDTTLARAAIEAVPTLIAVGGFLTATSERADVLLPCTLWGEKAGTVANIEGRVQRVNRKVAPEGTAMDDWRVAFELMARLGGDVDVAAVDEVTDELAQVAPAFAGVTSALVRRARDGVVLPLRAHRDELVLRARELSLLAEDGSGTSWDPIKVEGAPASDQEVDEVAAGPAEEPPPLHVWDGAAPSAEPPARDAYALRLVTGRTLYDNGRIMSESPALVGLRRAPGLRLNPTDAARVGAAQGGEVRVTSTRGSQVLRAAPDASVPAGCARYDWSADGDGPGALIDMSAPVTDVRVESVR